MQHCNGDNWYNARLLISTEEQWCWLCSYQAPQLPYIQLCKTYQTSSLCHKICLCCSLSIDSKQIQCSCCLYGNNIEEYHFEREKNNPKYMSEPRPMNGRKSNPRLYTPSSISECSCYTNMSQKSAIAVAWVVWRITAMEFCRVYLTISYWTDVRVPLKFILSSVWCWQLQMCLGLGVLDSEDKAFMSRVSAFIKDASSNFFLLSVMWRHIEDVRSEKWTITRYWIW